MFVVVSYDIIDDRRRARTAKAMKAFGDRVQKSVFECNLDKSELNKMLSRLRKILDESEDSIRIYSICADCKTSITILGWGEVSEDPDIIII